MNRESANGTPDLYAYDGARSGHGAHDDQDRSHEDGKSCKSSKIHNWHPDYSLSSHQARQWHKENEQSRHQPLKLNQADGTYTVQHGDCLSTIAARELETAGKPVDKKSVAHEVKKLIALNHKEHPELDCNKEFLEAGWKLRMPGCKASSQNPNDEPLVQNQTPGDVSIVDDQGRAMVQAGNIYGDGRGQGRQIMQPAGEFADQGMTANLSNNRTAIDPAGTDV